MDNTTLIVVISLATLGVTNLGLIFLCWHMVDARKGAQGFQFRESDGRQLDRLLDAAAPRTPKGFSAAPLDVDELGDAGHVQGSSESMSAGVVIDPDPPAAPNPSHIS